MHLLIVIMICFQFKRLILLLAKLPSSNALLDAFFFGKNEKKLEITDRLQSIELTAASRVGSLWSASMLSRSPCRLFRSSGV